MDVDTAHERVLEAAETLFYSHGIQTVGMDAIRAESGVSLKRLYQCFPAKNTLVAAYLHRRDARWRRDLSDFVAAHPTPAPRVLAVFDFLDRWFASPDFRGCAFINALGELGGTSEEVRLAARDHKQRLHAQVDTWLREDGITAANAASHLLLLIDGAIVSAATGLNPHAAQQARAVAATLLPL
ncbi:TetR/AcrR family transcriptional regulator [Salinactinospora qingdaonensis]|uniref:TetR/AcrR family transcriptional regulator n=1 Tax=Salinactinospora qingdaonensis TaxID=702744 RepID=A0ABP7G5M8_9ACTN